MGYLILPFQDDLWRWFLAPFHHADLRYAFVALVPVGIFGTLERRFGPLVPVALFVLCGAADSRFGGDARDTAVREPRGIFSLRINGAALGMLAPGSWTIGQAARRGEERDNDLLGVYVIAVVLRPLTTEAANIAVAVGGAALGALLGLGPRVLTRKSAY